MYRLRDDHDYLTKGDVFTDDLLTVYIDYKLEYECTEIDLRPHPYEFYLYNDI